MGAGTCTPNPTETLQGNEMGCGHCSGRDFITELLPLPPLPQRDELQLYFPKVSGQGCGMGWERLL